MGLRFGRYETLEPIAAGGMAKVYRGRAMAEGGFERIVAIKVMHSHLASDPGFVDMFLDEARLAAKICHPNVVATHDVQRSPVGTFLVMDYVDGVDFGMLQRALRTRSVKLPVELTLKIVIDALAGLAAAHELVDSSGASLNLVHRDVSPQNILIARKTGLVRLTDFGVAHAAERLGTTEAGALKGKLGYLSPEHARDGAVDARSDIYSAGVVLWEALTGRPMFVGKARVRVIADILQGRLETPISVDPEVPLHIADCCMKALALAPENRFQSAREFATSLRQAAQLDGLEVADGETLRAFVEASGAEQQSRKQNERLVTEEETLVESYRPVPVPKSTRARARARRGWIMVACAVGGVALLPLLAREAPRKAAVPAAVAAPQAPLPELDAKQPAPVEIVERVTVEDLTPPEAEAPPPRAPMTRAAKPREMYHPKGL